MKYYIANIDEQNGEFEISQTILFRAESIEQADKIHLYTVGTWYGEDIMEWNFHDERFYNDFVAVREGYLTEIDEHTFDQVYKHFAVDIALVKDTPIKSVAVGTVVLAEWTSDTGYVIVIKQLAVLLVAGFHLHGERDCKGGPK